MEDGRRGQRVRRRPLPARPRRSLWADVVYDELDDYHKKIMEHAFGVNGRRPLQNQEIARKMNRSPGPSPRRRRRIQKLLDEEHELAPEGI
jgi:hypothetical protein